MTFEDDNAQSVLTEQELSKVVGGTGTTIGPSGPGAVDPKAIVLGAGSNATNPGFSSDQFTVTSSGQG